jgi:hypothetical protein
MNKLVVMNILQREIDFHGKEIGEHKKLFLESESKTQKKKYIKHVHKRFQSVKIAKELGFDFCECCERLI